MFTITLSVKWIIFHSLQLWVNGWKCFEEILSVPVVLQPCVFETIVGDIKDERRASEKLLTRRELNIKRE